jgi:hypothetical protein
VGRRLTNRSTTMSVGHPVSHVLGPHNRQARQRPHPGRGRHSRASGTSNIASARPAQALIPAPSKGGQLPSPPAGPPFGPPTLLVHNGGHGHRVIILRTAQGLKEARWPSLSHQPPPRIKTHAKCSGLEVWSRIREGLGACGTGCCRAGGCLLRVSWAGFEGWSVAFGAGRCGLAGGLCRLGLLVVGLWWVRAAAGILAWCGRARSGSDRVASRGR